MKKSKKNKVKFKMMELYGREKEAVDMLLTFGWVVQLSAEVKIAYKPEKK